MLVAEITDGHGNKRQNSLGNVEIHFQYLETEGKCNKAYGHRHRVYDIITKIFFYIIPVRPEYKEFMTDIGIGDIDNIGQNQDDHVMYFIRKEIV